MVLSAFAFFLIFLVLRLMILPPFVGHLIDLRQSRDISNLALESIKPGHPQ